MWKEISQIYVPCAKRSYYSNNVRVIIYYLTQSRNYSLSTDLFGMDAHQNIKKTFKMKRNVAGR
jgi:hypothetical protein